MEKHNTARTASGIVAPETQVHLDLDDKPGSKIAAVLGLFIRGYTLNRFEAEDHHDHCLHSTVSSLQNDYGILIDRVSEKVPCLRRRKTVPVKRYWLDTTPANTAAARVLLAKLERRA